jgi:hypothetical protein
MNMNMNMNMDIFQRISDCSVIALVLYQIEGNINIVSIQKLEQETGETGYLTALLGVRPSSE